MTVTTTTSLHKPKLPILSLTVKAHQLFFQNAIVLLRMSSVWMLLVFLINATLYWCIWPAEVTSWPEPSHAYEVTFLVSTVLVTLAGASIAVNWHRAILLDEPVAHAPMLRLDPIVQTYFAAALFLTLMSILPVLTLTRMLMDTNGPPFVALVMTLTSLVMAVWIAVRLLPLFPAIACDERASSMSQTWTLSSGLFWRLLVGSCLTWALPILAAAAIVILDPNTSSDGPPTDRTAFALTTALVDTVTLYFGLIPTAFAAVVYGALSDETDPVQ
ncbi:MAG: hypothetical protein AAFV45_04275 [Pseudomonadota bacterium]